MVPMTRDLSPGGAGIDHPASTNDPKVPHFHRAAALAAGRSRAAGPVLSVYAVVQSVQVV